MKDRPTLRLPRAWALVAPTMILAGAVGPVHAVAQDPRDTLARDPLEIALQLNTSFHENFFPAPDGRPDTTVRAGTARIRFSEAWVDALGAEGYVDGRATVYDGFQSTYGTGGGILVAFWGQRLDVGLDYDWWLPRLDGGDAVGRADVGTARADYALRLGRLVEFSATGRARRERAIGRAEPVPPAGGPEPESGLASARDPWVDHTFEERGGAVRLLALGRIFSPEVGVVWGRPRGVDPGQAYEQRQTHVQVRSLPHPRAYLGARLRIRERSYLEAPPESGNHRREDRREQWTLLAEIRLTDSVSTVWYYAQEAGTSTRDLRDFSTRSLTAGLKLRRD